MRQGGGARHVGRYRAGEQPREEFRTIIRDFEQRLVQHEFEHFAAPDITTDAIRGWIAATYEKFCSPVFPRLPRSDSLTVNAAVFTNRRSADG